MERGRPSLVLYGTLQGDWFAVRRILTSEVYKGEVPNTILPVLPMDLWASCPWLVPNLDSSVLLNIHPLGVDNILLAVACRWLHVIKPINRALDSVLTTTCHRPRRETLRR